MGWGEGKKLHLNIVGTRILVTCCLNELFYLLIKLFIFVLGFSKNDPKCLGLLSGSHIHIIPQLDPDGHQRAVLGDCSGHQSTGTSEFHSLSLEDPKLQALQAEFDTNQFRLVVSLAAGGQYIV